MERRKMGETPIETPREPLEEPLDETAIGPHTERVTLGQSRRDVLCGAKTSAGTPCRRRPIKGGTKCVLHGGGSPLARQAAERRLLYGTSLAIDRLIDALSEHDHEGPCALCGCNPSSRDPNTLRAAIALLDRSGFGPGLKLQHTSEENDDGIREIRRTIVDPDPERKAEAEEQDRLIRARLHPRHELTQLEAGDTEQPARKDNSVVIDLEAN